MRITQARIEMFQRMYDEMGRKASEIDTYIKNNAGDCEALQHYGGFDYNEYYVDYNELRTEWTWHCGRGCCRESRTNTIPLEWVAADNWQELVDAFIAKHKKEQADKRAASFRQAKKEKEDRDRQEYERLKSKYETEE